MAELAAHCFDGADETGGSCVGGGGGKGLEAALGAGPALAVCVLETDPAWPTGFGVGWSTTWTGLGARVVANSPKTSGPTAGPRVIWTVCGR